MANVQAPTFPSRDFTFALGARTAMIPSGGLRPAETPIMRTSSGIAAMRSTKAEVRRGSQAALIKVAAHSSRRSPALTFLAVPPTGETRDSSSNAMATTRAVTAMSIGGGSPPGATNEENERPILLRDLARAARHRRRDRLRLSRRRGSHRRELTAAACWCDLPDGRRPLVQAIPLVLAGELLRQPSPDRADTPRRRARGGGKGEGRLRRLHLRELRRTG